MTINISKKLDDYTNSYVYENLINQKFTQKLTNELKEISPIFQIQANNGVVSISLHDLSTTVTLNHHTGKGYTLSSEIKDDITIVQLVGDHLVRNDNAHFNFNSFIIMHIIPALENQLTNQQ